MADFPPVYPYSRGEAIRRNELPAWEESFHNNAACARSIETAIQYFFGRSAGTLRRGCAEAAIELYGFMRIGLVLANTVDRYSVPDRLSEDTRNWAKDVHIPDDGDYRRYFEVDTATSLLEAFIGQYRYEYQQLGLFGAEHCTRDQDYEGKVLILSPETLRESCWRPQDQLWYALVGASSISFASGASPKAHSFHCASSSRQTRSAGLCRDKDAPLDLVTRWNRADFTGVLDENHLPDWAAEKLAELRDPAQAQTRAEGPSMTMN